MNIGPKNFNDFTFGGDGIYVVIESLPDVPFSEHNYKVIGAAYSYETAKKYGGPNRTIKGPIPLFDTKLQKPFDPNPIQPYYPGFKPNPDLFPPNLYDPLTPVKPKFDFTIPLNQPKYNFGAMPIVDLYNVKPTTTFSFDPKTSSSTTQSYTTLSNSTNDLLFKQFQPTQQPFHTFGNNNFNDDNMDLSD